MAKSVGLQLRTTEWHTFTVATANTMTFFFYDSLRKKKYDEAFVISTMIPEIRHIVSKSKIEVYKDVVKLSIPPFVKKCTLSPKLVLEALHGKTYRQQTEVAANNEDNFEDIDQFGTMAPEKFCNGPTQSRINEEVEIGDSPIAHGSPIIIDNEAEATNSTDDSAKMLEYVQDIVQEFKSQLVDTVNVNTLGLERVLQLFR